MAQRESSVFLYLFVVAMMLFVLMTVGFFMKHNELPIWEEKYADLEADLDKTKVSNQKLLGDNKKLRAFIVGEGEVSEFPQADGLIQDMTGELKRLAAKISEANKDLNRNADVSFSYLVEPYSKFPGIFSAYRLMRDEAVTERDEADKTFTAAIASREDTIKTLTKDLAEQRSLVAEAQQEVEDAKSSHLTVVERLKQEFEEKEEEWTEKELGTNRQLQRKDSEIGTLGILVKKLQARDRQLLTIEDAKPDGKLVHVSNELGKGWVNIGRKNHLKTGLIFRVYRPIKGGKKMYKGRIEVRQVDEQQAEVRIIEQVDPERNPVTSGDLITSPFYDQKEEPIFVFAGTKLTSQEMTEDFLRAKLKGYGVAVKGSVDINTSYLVALQDYEKTTEFKVAERLGVPVLREKELMEFIGY